MTKRLHSLKGDSSHKKDNGRKWVARVTRGNRRDGGQGRTNGTGERGNREHGRTEETRGTGGTREGKGDKGNRVTTRTEEKGEHG